MKFKWDLRIEKIENGYTLTYDEDHEDGAIEKINVVEDNDDETQCMMDMLWFVKDYFGSMYNKHDEENISIKLEKNDL